MAAVAGRRLSEGLGHARAGAGRRAGFGHGGTSRYCASVLRRRAEAGLPRLIKAAANELTEDSSGARAAAATPGACEVGGEGRSRSLSGYRTGRNKDRSASRAGKPR